MVLVLEAYLVQVQRVNILLIFMKAKIISTVLFSINTLISFIVLLNVLSGNIGNKEVWRIAFSLIGFIILFSFNVFLIYRINRS